jgi:hypothetical protein
LIRVQARSEGARSCRRGIGFARLLAASIALATTGPAMAGAAASTPVAQSALATPAVTRVATWIRTSADNAGLAFIIVDKRSARVFAFAADGALRGTAPALLGAPRGDINPPGIGDRPLAAIGPQDRITAAGRYVAQLGNDLGKADILWVDYAAGLSLHRVIAGRPADQRRRRLMSPAVDDNRISYGCINVPAEFFDAVVVPLFRATTGIVYVLPEDRPLEAVFPLAATKG